MSLLDDLYAPTNAAHWWDGFYENRSRDVPFFAAKPDESLAGYVEDGTLTPGRALDLGCGPGRNALHLASRGWRVDAVDLSPEAIRWAEERARASGAEIQFRCGDAFAPGAVEGPYDLVYDSGCFHHLPPHRRVGHLALLDRVLAPGGHFGLACFAVGGMGSELPDAAHYRDPAPHGGLAYTADELRWIFDGMEEIELRRMKDEPPESPRFGEPFLWAALFRR
ncbi:class I SAM-dependent methyltransferase [Streptomyces sp. NPDC048172]|uniref:class I SAM-dependent methyltransferase n=1 Tax=Streptomyces sp. NPDC048172 TaxID=3365505 RepID=UPI003720FF15